MLVAQHSILVLTLRLRASLDRMLDRGEMLRELLHDADEGMLSFDPIAPLRPYLGADYHELVARLRQALAARYRLPVWDQPSYALHKDADRLAAASEAVHVAGWPVEELPDTLGIDVRPLTHDSARIATRLPALGAMGSGRCCRPVPQPSRGAGRRQCLPCQLVDGCRSCRPARSRFGFVRRPAKWHHPSGE